jgi:signal transduction histidine kinase
VESLTHVPIDWIFPDDIYRGWSDRLCEADRGKGRERVISLVAFGPSGKRIFSVRVASLEGEPGEDRGFVVSLDDVTAQKETEQRMFDLERLADKGVMASSIAHELNNFLGMLLGGVELAELNLSRGKVDKTEGTIAKLKGHVSKMKRFTAGLMDYGKLNTSKSLGNLNPVISDVLSFISVQRKFSNVKVDTVLADGLPDFNLDSDQMAQLLLNLLNNAADAISEAGSKAGKIRITTSSSEGRILLSVADNGVGIKPQVREHLFRSHLTTKEGGHGYGLVTCARIIDNHNGRVDIVSEVGQGATFCLHFPIQVAEEVSEQ